jgi:hypothetical protein
MEQRIGPYFLCDVIRTIDALDEAASAEDHR